MDHVIKAFQGVDVSSNVFFKAASCECLDIRNGVDEVSSSSGIWHRTTEWLAPTSRDSVPVLSSQVELSNHAWYDPLKVKSPMAMLIKEDGKCTKYTGN